MQIITIVVLGVGTVLAVNRLIGLLQRIVVSLENLRNDVVTFRQTVENRHYPAPAPTTEIDLRNIEERLDALLYRFGTSLEDFQAKKSRDVAERFQKNMHGFFEKLQKNGVLEQFRLKEVDEEFVTLLYMGKLFRATRLYQRIVGCDPETSKAAVSEIVRDLSGRGFSFAVPDKNRPINEILKEWSDRHPTNSGSGGAGSGDSPLNSPIQQI